MIAVDTSVVIAAYATWHEAHLMARRILDRAPRLPGHAGLEAYSVLTRLPRPNRASAADVQAFLQREFREPWLALPGPEVAALIPRLIAAGIIGGATYDALIAATAQHAGARLVTYDRRALVLYERLGVEVEFLG